MSATSSSAISPPRSLELPESKEFRGSRVRSVPPGPWGLWVRSDRSDSLDFLPARRIWRSSLDASALLFSISSDGAIGHSPASHRRDRRPSSLGTREFSSGSCLVARFPPPSSVDLRTTRPECSDPDSHNLVPFSSRSRNGLRALLAAVRSSRLGLRGFLRRSRAAFRRARFSNSCELAWSPRLPGFSLRKRRNVHSSGPLARLSALERASKSSST